MVEDLDLHDEPMRAEETKVSDEWPDGGDSETGDERQHVEILGWMMNAERVEDPSRLMNGISWRLKGVDER